MLMSVRVSETRYQASTCPIRLDTDHSRASTRTERFAIEKTPASAASGVDSSPIGPLHIGIVCKRLTQISKGHAHAREAS